MLKKILDDRRCAKIILTRNPVDSYVSLKIAKATGQWKLSDAKKRRSAQIRFDADEFDEHVDRMQQFQMLLQNALQVTGQTAFHVAYDDLENLQVLNGIAQYLGLEDRLTDLDKSMKKQNPGAMADKVENHEEMEASLRSRDWFDLSRTPNFEPRRGPSVRNWTTAAKAALLYVPMHGGLDEGLEHWMARLDGVSPAALGRQRSQNDLRAWFRENPNSLRFCVLRHPLVRAHDVFCRQILPTEDDGYKLVRKTLMQRYKLPLPKQYPCDGYDREAHYQAFAAFLDFLKANLAEQTSIRCDQLWASQAQVLQGVAEFALPDLILRESDLPAELPRLAARVGYADAPGFEPVLPALPFVLSDIYQPELDAKARQAYARDYVLYGFEDWSE